MSAEPGANRMDEAPAAADSKKADLVNSVARLLASTSQQTLNELINHSALLDVLSHSFPGGICVFDAQSQISYCNRGFIDLLEYPQHLFRDAFPSLNQLLDHDREHIGSNRSPAETLISCKKVNIEPGKGYCIEFQHLNRTIIEFRGMPLASGSHVVLFLDITERHSRAKNLEVLLENYPGGICVFDKNNNMVLHNRKLLKLLEYSEELFRNGPPNLEQIFRFNAERGEYGEGDVEKKVAERMNLVSQRLPHVYDRRRPNGTVLEVRGIPVENGGFVTSYIDVTEQRERSEQIEVLIENFPGAIAMYNRHLDMTIYNDCLIELLEYPKEMFNGKMPNLKDIFAYNAERGEYGEGNVEELVSEKLKLVAAMEPHQYERLRPDGKYIEVRGVPLEGGGFVTTYQDVSERRRNQALLAHMAHHDELTGLPNRILFKERLDQASAQARRGYHFALLYLDLNKFKPVNDTFGHAIGDELLKQVAERIEAVRRDTDTLARLGGDEFAMVQIGIDGRKSAEILADRIVETLDKPFTIEGHEIKIGTCIGIALSGENGCDTEDLLRKADSALYAAKSGDGINYAFHSDIEES